MCLDGTDPCDLSQEVQGMNLKNLAAYSNGTYWAHELYRSFKFSSLLSHPSWFREPRLRPFAALPE